MKNEEATIKLLFFVLQQNSAIVAKEWLSPNGKDLIKIYKFKSKYIYCHTKNSKKQFFGFLDNTDEALDKYIAYAP